MIDQVALWIGYAFLYVGGVLLALTMLFLAAWAILDLWWRRYGNWKLLREFLRWKRNGWSPEDAGK